MQKIAFVDGQKVSSAKVTIDEVDYPVTPARYSGATPLSSTVMNTMQDNIEDAINQNVDNIGGEEYDDTATYEVGDIVKYEGQLYICIEAVETAEEFDSTKWNATDVLSSAGGNEIAIGSASDITGKTKIFVDESTQTLQYKDTTTGQFTNIAGDEVFIGDIEEAPDTTKLVIDDDGVPMFSSEVVNSLSGDETAKAPSVHAVKEALSYSTTEQVVGTWIDGKPLYRKVLTGTLPNDVNFYTLLEDVSYYNIQNCIIGADLRPYEYFIFSSNNSGALDFVLLNGDLQIRARSGTVYGFPYILVLEYTKTTDVVS